MTREPEQEVLIQVYNLAKELLKSKAEERLLQNKLDDVRRKLVSTEAELWDIIKPN
jgi:hypothetical protein